ncbi:hypothetical protein, variant [Sphaeroforma arctica JP610]|nr:hypothetical protein, variant [Sphaeroforma arctica JP610]KNC80725.1 hypothetical protein, variant [Sphaeroforma arctica JP610]|eukprot:XP_014154627.1 hypothetical protein, variant [Sphaeroforma arctica JP610]
MQRKNPRKISWTVLFRRKAKKGTQMDEKSRKKTRKAVKSDRAIGGLTREALMAKRNETSEIRKARRDHISKEKKDKIQAAKVAKKTNRGIKNTIPVAKNNKGKQNIRTGGLR